MPVLPDILRGINSFTLSFFPTNQDNERHSQTNEWKINLISEDRLQIVGYKTICDPKYP